VAPVIIISSKLKASARVRDELLLLFRLRTVVTRYEGAVRTLGLYDWEKDTAAQQAGERVATISIAFRCAVARALDDGSRA
jgi:hypothetical protein